MSVELGERVDGQLMTTILDSRHEGEQQPFIRSPKPVYQLVTEYRSRNYPNEGEIIQVNGIPPEMQDYNPTVDFESQFNGVKGRFRWFRADIPHKELSSEIFLTAKQPDGSYQVVPDFPVIKGEDPRYFEIHGKNYVTFVEVDSYSPIETITPEPDPVTGTYRETQVEICPTDKVLVDHIATAIHRFTDLDDLKANWAKSRIGYIRDMKDVTLSEKDDETLVVHGRPQGKVGGRGIITMTEFKVGQLESGVKITQEHLANSIPLDGQVPPENWIASHQAIYKSNRERPLSDDRGRRLSDVLPIDPGQVFILGHAAEWKYTDEAHYGEDKYIEKDPLGRQARNYVPVGFVVDLVRKLRSPLKVLAERGDLPPSKIKYEALENIFIPAGLELVHGEDEGFSIVLSGGLSDGASGIIDVTDRFIGPNRLDFPLVEALSSALPIENWIPQEINQEKKAA